MEKKQLIGWGVLMGLVSTFLIVKFGKKSIFSSIAPATSYETKEVGDIIITKPISDAKSYNVIYVFGGISYANKKWMKEQMPKSYFLHNVVVLADYIDSFSAVKRQLESFLSQNGLKQGEVSIIGFSAGGVNVLNAYNKDFKFVGLIDPSNKPQHLNISFGKNAYMVYNTANWGAYPTIQDNMNKIAKNVSNGGGFSSPTKMSHKEIPKYFFINYTDVHKQ